MGITQDSLGLFITLSHIFGTFPVSRRKIRGREQLYFKWKSFPVIHTLIVIFLFIMDFLFFVYAILQDNMTFNLIGMVFYYACIKQLHNIIIFSSNWH